MRHLTHFHLFALVALVLLLAQANEARAALSPRRLDGVLVGLPGANRWPIAVMIDNHPLARPQAGLDKASIVYETLAEGGIPRFMVVFAQKDIPLIGPVRSARPYFVRYAAEYGAAVAHAGGSGDALRAIQRYRLANIEGLTGGTARFFVRRFGTGVHNLYTNGGLLQNALRYFHLTREKPTYRPWKFKNDTPLSRRPTGVHGVTINLGAGTQYLVRYQYDRKRNAYTRFTGGKLHRDRVTGRQLFVKNVLILRVPKEVVLDRQGRLDIRDVGIDKGVLFQNGRARTIVWKKLTPRARMVVYDLNGKEVQFVRGSVWIDIVPRGHGYNIF